MSTGRAVQRRPSRGNSWTNHFKPCPSPLSKLSPVLSPPLPDMYTPQVQSQQLGIMWNAASEDEKKPYQAQADAASAQYQMEMEEWKLAGAQASDQ